MQTADGDAPRDEARRAAKRRRRLSERERQALRAATARAASGAKAAIAVQVETVALPSDDLTAAWASADVVPATQIVAMMGQAEPSEIAARANSVDAPRHEPGGESTGELTAASSDVPGDRPIAPDAAPSQVGESDPVQEEDSGKEFPDRTKTETAGAVGAVQDDANAGALGATANASNDPVSDGDATRIAKSAETEVPTEAQSLAEAARVPEANSTGVIAAVEVAPSLVGSQAADAAPPLGEAEEQAGTHVTCDTATLACDAAAPSLALEAPDESAANQAVTVPLAEPESRPCAVPTVAVPPELFEFAEVIEPGIAELAPTQVAHSVDSPTVDTDMGSSSDGQVEAARIAEASAAEDVAAMAAIVAAANTDAPSVHEVSLEALEEALTVDESAPPPNHGALTISEAELSALAEPAAEPVAPAVEVGHGSAGAEPIPASSGSEFAESAPTTKHPPDHEAITVATASDLEVLQTVLGAESEPARAPGADVQANGGNDVNPMVLAELARVQEALREVLDAAPIADQSSAEIHVLKSQLQGLAAEVHSLRTPAPAEPAPTPRQPVVIAAEHLLLVGGGFAMLAWSLASLFSGNQTKLTLLGVIAANLAFAAAILRSGRATR